MSPYAFVYWLRGFLDRSDSPYIYEADAKVIAAVLATVVSDVMPKKPEETSPPDDEIPF